MNAFQNLLPWPLRPQGTVNAGFGTTWTEGAARLRAYRRAPAVAELRQAMRGTELPVTDEPETLGDVVP